MQIITPLRIHPVYKRKNKPDRLPRTARRVRNVSPKPPNESRSARTYTGRRILPKSARIAEKRISRIVLPDLISADTKKISPRDFDAALKRIEQLELKRKQLRNCRFITTPSGNRYSLIEVIGEGTFGKVFRAFGTTGSKEFAIKVLERIRIKTVEDAQRVSRELQILKHVSHDNIIKFTDLVETRNAIFIVLELMQEELYSYIVARGRLQLHEVKDFLLQLLNGLDYLHQEGIIHRDLKPENLLLKGTHLRITDFGLSAIVKQKSKGYLLTSCGSPCYAAPELVAGVPYDGTKTDIWAVGIVLFAMICGYLPFDNPDTAKLYEMILSVDFKIPTALPKDGADLISKILVFSPIQRLYFPEIYKHKFLEQYANKTVIQQKS